MNNKALTLKYGAWSKKEAGIADDVKKINTKYESWQVLLQAAQFDAK